jgi:uncharacterized protein
MTDETLETYVRQFIEQQASPEIHFAWQGGEPTLLGVNFFARRSGSRKNTPTAKKIHNAFQTNGTLLDDEWCEFLVENHFLVGLSIDGPPKLHDAYRVDKKGKPK